VRLSAVARSAVVLALALVLVAQPASAMEAKVIGNQLILSGAVVKGDSEKIQALLAGNASIDTVVLRNSFGGDIESGYRAGELFRAKGLTTAVSGFCYSSCSRMFLGGKNRVFTDDYPALYTNVGFHGHYDTKTGKLVPELVKEYDLLNWTIKYSDGKADPALVERWVNIPFNSGMIHFYDPALYVRDGVSTFMCQGTETMARAVLGCEPIAKTALDLGIVTSLDIAKSNDQTEVRAKLPRLPKPSGYATLYDFQKLPMAAFGSTAAASSIRALYLRFLDEPLPRAFAIRTDIGAATFISGNPQAATLALRQCSENYHGPCLLYAIDYDVVWGSK